MKVKFPVEGLVSEYPLFRLLADISASKLSGVLTISGDDDTVDIFLNDGNCVRVDSHYPRDGFLLGQLMKFRGYCTDEQLNALLEQQADSLVLLGKLAVEADYLSDNELSRLLEDQMLLVMFPCLSWRKGVYYFQLKDKVPYPETSIRPIDLKPIFRIGPKIHKSWKWMRERISDDDLIPTRVEGVTVVPEGVQVEHSADSNAPVVLTRPQEKIYEFVDGVRSIREICDSVHLFEWTARVSLIDLQDASVITIPKKVQKKKRAKGIKEETGKPFTLPSFDFNKIRPVLIKSLGGVGIIAILCYGASLIDWKTLVQPTSEKVAVIQYVSPKFENLTRYHAEQIGVAVTLHYLYNSIYPKSLTSLLDAELIESDVLLDGWGSEFVYESKAGEFKLFSTGPDKELGTEDDLALTGQTGNHVFGCYFSQTVTNAGSVENETEGETS